MAEPIPVRPDLVVTDTLESSSPSRGHAPRALYRVVLDDVPSKLKDSYRYARQSLEDAASGARHTLRNLASERPLHLALGVALISFAAGIGLRLWRSHYE